MTLLDSLNAFRDSVTEVNTYFSLAFRQDMEERYILPKNQRDFICDSAFLRLFIGWETFLERTFIQYMLGEPSILGVVIDRYVQPIDEKHASRIIIGTQKYADWSNPEIVRRLSLLFFPAGNPFDLYISSIDSELSDLKTARNAAAHLSSTTQKQLDALGTRLLRRHCQNMIVSDLIFANNPDVAVNETILTTYLTKLDICAEGIANGR